MQYKNKLFIVDNDGNEHDISKFEIGGNGEILVKDPGVIIEKGFKIITKKKGVCSQIFLVNQVTTIYNELILINVKEF